MGRAATAILIDATVVRMVLVPATMALLGKANWWLPTWLDRLLPRLSVDGQDVEVDVAGPDVDAGQLEPLPASAVVGGS